MDSLTYESFLILCSLGTYPVTYVDLSRNTCPVAITVPSVVAFEKGVNLLAMRMKLNNAYKMLRAGAAAIP